MKQTLKLTTATMILVAFLTGCENADTATQKPNNSVSKVASPNHDDHGNESEAGHDVVKMSDVAAQEAGIVSARAAYGEIAESLSLPAEIRFDADRVANVSPKVSGIIGKLYVSEGDVVQQGNRLALIRSRELAGLKAAWLTAKTREKLADTGLAREEKLFASEITSEADLQNARAEAQAAKAASDAAMPR